MSLIRIEVLGFHYSLTLDLDNSIVLFYVLNPLCGENVIRLEIMEVQSVTSIYYYHFVVLGFRTPYRCCHSNIRNDCDS